MSTRTVLVTGATGQQGGAVARQLLASGVAVRALVRDVQATAAQSIAAQGATLVAGDMADPESLTAAVRGADGVFSVQPLLLGKPTLEIALGRNVADAAKQAGVSHLVYSSAFGAHDAPDVPHFASKAEIENHILTTGVPATILRPSGFMENLLMPRLRDGIVKGKLMSPSLLETRQPLIAMDDIGTFAAMAFAAPDQYIGRTIPLVGDVLTAREQADVLSRVLGWPMRPAKLPWLIVRFALGKDLYNMFRWMDARGMQVPFDVEALRRAHPGLLSFPQWVEQRFKPAVQPMRRGHV